MGMDRVTNGSTVGTALGIGIVIMAVAIETTTAAADTMTITTGNHPGCGS